ncbi:MAG: SDR family oxidoreductase [Pseudomonadota bacterium]
MTNPFPAEPGTLLTFGHGYSAAALAARLLPAGWRVVGTTRSAERAGALVAQGVEPLIWDGVSAPPAVRAAIAEATHVLTSAAPVAGLVPGGDPVLAAFRTDLAAAASHLAWVGYLSTTGVYGDRGGAWVDEDSTLGDAGPRGRARVVAEDAWRALAGGAGLALHVFRLAGIYGPGRGPFAKIRAGTARRIVKPGQVFSRIHVQDIATVLAASIARPLPGAYNVCDDEPAPPETVIEHAAHLLGRPPPPAVDWEKAEMTPMARSFYAESRRVSNARLRRDLGVTLAYPTYREGLAAVLAAEQTS